MDLFQPFKSNISSIPLPEKFTFPFYYEPHPLSRIAAEEVMQYLENQTDFQHNFGLGQHADTMVIGKMFGVLVVKNEAGELGYLAAFSGKLAESNHLAFFIPPVFDTLTEDGFYKNGEAQLNAYNHEIEILENNPEYHLALREFNRLTTQAETELTAQKERIKSEKKKRDLDRQNVVHATEKEKNDFELQLSEASKKESIILKKMTKYWRLTLETAKLQVGKFESEITQRKETRRLLSASLQQQLFANYTFLNSFGVPKSLGSIFNENPPAGAGECAAPKLLQYAYSHKLNPICMAEFWWGASPKSEVRKHKQFYPACTGKCEPILGHMLEGIETDTNPFKINTAEGKDIAIVYEDDYLLLINKPAEFLSVPGKLVTDSVYTRIKERYPNADGPLIVHRLDMSTSGLLLIAKTGMVYKKLQAQFIQRTVKKRYLALLDGILKKDSGTISLPLRVDLDNRPIQIVCYEYGKPAETHFEVIKRYQGKTLVYFYPHTGRTHQLRVHAAHPDGLNAPIIGDDLYGTKANRLHLQAESITFIHPITKEEMSFRLAAEF